MKASDYIVILLLVVGLGALGFLFTQQDKSVEEIFAEISGKVTGDSGEPVIPVSESEKQKQSQNPFAVTPAETNNQVETTNQDIYKIDINLPPNFIVTSGRSIPSVYENFEKEVTRVEKKDQEEGWVEEMFVIDQYFSKEGFGQALTKNINPETYPGLRVVSAPVENLIIDGQDSEHYILSLYRDSLTYSNEILTNNHFVSIPSKQAIIKFEHNPVVSVSLFELQEIMDTISKVTFNTNPENKLVSKNRSLEKVSSDTSANKKEEAFGLSISLPNGLSIEKSMQEDNVAFISFPDLGILTITRYKNKEEFDKNLPLKEDPNNKEEGFEYVPVYKTQIDGQEAIHYDSNIRGTKFYQVTVPSKLLITSFFVVGVDQTYVDYTLEDYKNIISSIKFNY